MNTETPIYEQLVTPYVLEEHDWELECESIYHGTATVQGTWHSGPATVIQVGGCRALEGFRCQHYVNNYLAFRAAGKPTPICVSCDAVHDVSFIPLDVS